MTIMERVFNNIKSTGIKVPAISRDRLYLEMIVNQKKWPVGVTKVYYLQKVWQDSANISKPKNF